MQRYAYDFVLYLDIDEFLWLRSDYMEKSRPLQVQIPSCTYFVECTHLRSLHICSSILSPPCGHGSLAWFFYASSQPLA